MNSGASWMGSHKSWEVGLLPIKMEVLTIEWCAGQHSGKGVEVAESGVKAECKKDG